MKNNIHIKKETIDKMVNGFKFGVTYMFIKANTFETKLVSGILDLDPSELKGMEEDDIQTMKEKYHIGRK